MAEITVWTIYRDPSDYPGKWVLRAFEVGAGLIRTRTECVVTDTYDDVRAALPRGLHRLPRNVDDDPVVYETWV